MACCEKIEKYDMCEGEEKNESSYGDWSIGWCWEIDVC